MTTKVSELTHGTSPILFLDLGKFKSCACIYCSVEENHLVRSQRN
jgi:hypothetical protein